MPEEQKSPSSPEKIEIQAAPDTANTADGAPPMPVNGAPASSKPVPSFVGFGLLIAALMVVVFVMTNPKIIERMNRKSATDSKALEALSADLEASRSDINRQRMAMGLRPLEGGTESMDEVAKRLNKDATTLVALANSFQKLLEEKNAVLDAKNSELLRSEQLRQSLSAELSRKDSQISRLSLEGSDGELAKREVADLKAQRDSLRAELAKMKATAGQPNDDYALLQKRYDEARRSSDFFEKRVKELEGDLAKLRIFAKSESELLPAAVELFRTLRNLEGKKDSDNMTAYSDIGVKLGARVLKTLDFPTGSAVMSEVDQSEVPSLINQAEDGDLILVVGYASTTGNVEANRVLSSDRATAAAQAISALKRPGQMVQAVYIGQTNRFSSAAPERNQICEVWHIKKK